MHVDISDLTHLTERLQQAAPQARRLAKLAVVKATTDTTADAKRLAPVDTGYLRSSITQTISDNGDSFEGETGPFAHYGAFVEFGTSRMGPQPYMGPAFDRHSRLFVQACEQIPDIITRT